MNKLYNWMMRQAESKNAASVLMFISFIESSFFPLPPDPILAVVIAKNKHRAFYYAAICTLASVVGGLFGYYIGYEFFELVGSKILGFYGQASKFDELVRKLNEWAFWLICIKGVTPIPYKVVTIASGFAKINLMIFTTASIITRSTRFFVLSAICQKYGESFLNFTEKHKAATLYIIIFSVILGFALLKLLM
ncbi:MAG: DedA family protein [Holosporaceae bacterium]|nr:DedA family protein [Holosporaceae bacterium]